MCGEHVMTELTQTLYNGITEILVYIERVAEFHWRSSGPPLLPATSVSVFCMGFGPASCSALLRGERYQILHEFVQIEGQDRPRTRHLQRWPKTFLGSVAFVPVAFQRPNASLGPTPLAANLIPDS